MISDGVVEVPWEGSASSEIPCLFLTISNLMTWGYIEVRLIGVYTSCLAKHPEVVSMNWTKLDCTLCTDPPDPPVLKILYVLYDL